MAVHGEAAVWFEGRRQQRIEQIGERAPDDIGRVDAGASQGLAVRDEAAQRPIEDDGDAAAEIGQRRGPAGLDTRLAARADSAAGRQPSTTRLGVELRA
jgi:hypothetical protein